MKILKQLFERNRAWANRVTAGEPDFFMQLSKEQAPRYLWIGCSDSRVPANQIVDLPPGELFVHRNIANLVVHTDLNCLSVIQFAIEVLRVEHVIVCGHYGCGGILAALEDVDHGLIDNWLHHIRDLYRVHRRELAPLDALARFHRLCELNVIEQVANVCQTTILRSAWKAGQEVAVHGWIYDVEDGLLRDLDVCITRFDQLPGALRGR